MSTTSLYADVILPLAIPPLTYSVPDDIAKSIAPGCRVEVPLGLRKQYTGIVWKLHTEAPAESYEMKNILALHENTPIVREDQLAFWQWIARYYMCTLGEVMKAALPLGLKAKNAYKPKCQTFLRLTKPYRSDASALMQWISTSASRAKKQVEALLFFTSDGKDLSAEWSKEAYLEKSALSSAVLKSLVDKGLIECYEQRLSRLARYEGRASALNTLNAPQAKAMEEIQRQWQSKEVCLLHGVTSSGKTEIYIHLIQECLRQGKQALYLLPEIALTTQITNRLKAVFGDRMGIYHSKFSDAERVEIWNNLLGDEAYDVIVGVRSSVFLPFRQLGLVIVDEEHENSYKQQEPAPRYHARSAALVLARNHGAKTLLGTATPSLESYKNVRDGRYGLVELFSRYREMQMPKIYAVDVRELRRKKIMKSIFAPLLIEKMQQAFAAGEQVILFQNRRGYAPIVTCKDCGWVPHCTFCDVSLTYHKQSARLRCHYCGQEHSIPASCPQCGSTSLSVHGFGTEKVEEDVRTLFPQIRVARMDADVMQNRNAYEKVISAFEKRETDLLVGTQMLTKGLDFDNVSVVGILNADAMMNFPDFRASERAFHLMVQVSGRSGRKNKQGCVIIQTSDTKTALIAQVVRNDFQAMYENETQERRLYSYPPYSCIIDVWLKHKDATLLRQAAMQYADCLRPVLGDAVSGPFPPPVSRVKNLFIQKITLKIDTQLSLNKIKEYLCAAKNDLGKQPAFRSVLMYFDVDPL